MKSIIVKAISGLLALTTLLSINSVMALAVGQETAITYQNSKIEMLESEAVIENIDIDNIINLLQTYFDVKSRSLKTFIYSEDQFDAFFDLNDSVSVNSKFRDFIALKARIEHYKVQNTELKSKYFSNNISLNNYSKLGDDFKVEIINDYTIGYFDTDIEEIGVETHEFVIRKVNNEWKIISHEYEDDFLNLMFGESMTMIYSHVSFELDQSLIELKLDEYLKKTCEEINGDVEITSMEQRIGFCPKRRGN